MPVCPQCNNRSLTTKEGLRQHMKTSSAFHPFCETCDRRFIDEIGYNSHMAAKHPPTYDCDTCNRSYHVPFALEDHYRGSRAHPNCLQCGRGFKDAQACEEHHRTSHPHVLCVPCGITMYEEHLDQHQTESPKHPSCASCQRGFKDDIAYTEYTQNYVVTPVGFTLKRPRQQSTSQHVSDTSKMHNLQRWIQGKCKASRASGLAASLPTQIAIP